MVGDVTLGERLFQSDPLAQGNHTLVFKFQPTPDVQNPWIEVDYLVVKPGNLKNQDVPPPGKPQDESNNKAPPAPPTESPGKQSMIGPIAGGVVGGLALVLLIVGGIILRKRRRRRFQGELSMFMTRWSKIHISKGPIEFDGPDSPIQGEFESQLIKLEPFVPPARSHSWQNTVSESDTRRSPSKEVLLQNSSPPLATSQSFTPYTDSGIRLPTNDPRPPPEYTHN